MSNKKRNSILCPNCNKLISKDEDTCPYCGVGKPGSWLKNNTLMKGLFQDQGAISAIIILNLLFYLISIFAEPSYLLKTLSSSNFLAWLSPSSKVLVYLGMTGTVTVNYGYWWSLINANYLHGGILHIAFNMYALYSLAPLVIEEYGANRFIVIFTFGGIGSYIVSYFAGITYTLGASGAVCALIGAILFYGYKRGGTYGKELMRQAGSWIFSLVIFGLIVSSINNWAHFGGIASGALLGFGLKYKQQLSEKFFHKWLAAFSILITIASLSWGVFNIVRAGFFG